MITELNRFLIALGCKIPLALKEAQFPSEPENHQYNNGYYQALLDMQSLAQDIHNGRNGY